MSIRKRKTKYGKTPEYHYEFMQNKKRYYGVCEGCTTERAAIAYEKKQKETVKKLAGQESLGALFDNFKRELIGGGTVTLSKAFTLYLQKPARRHRGEKQIAAKQSYWSDFCAFMNNTAPEVDNLDKITKTHAEAYINHLKTQGRFIREVKNGNSRRYSAVKRLSNSTINVYHKTIRAVFTKLQEDAGIIFNPFDFDMLEKESSTRDVFSPEELQLIGNNLDGFVRPIFVIGICTGLSEGDICLLRWKDIQGNWICCERKKTKVVLDIPILPPLAAFLEEQRSISGKTEFVLPEHAEMYQCNPSGISYRVKQFLEGLGIKTTKDIPGRSRAVSIKDVHSLRHSFAFLAGCYQIPLPVVQSILGHMSQEMTKHYQLHADRRAKEKYLSKMPNFLNTASPAKQLTQEGYSNASQERRELATIIERLSDDAVKEMLAFAKKLHVSATNKTITSNCIETR
jgi:integrase